MAVDRAAVLQRYLDLDQPDDAVFCTYVFVDGTLERTRCKTRTLDFEPKSAEECPEWTFCALASYQWPDAGPKSEAYLSPVALFRDPFLKGRNKLVLCEVLQHDRSPMKTNTRRSCLNAMNKAKDQQPWFGIEQEYVVTEKDGHPVDWPRDAKHTIKALVGIPGGSPGRRPRRRPPLDVALHIGPRCRRLRRAGQLGSDALSTGKLARFCHAHELQHEGDAQRRRHKCHQSCHREAEEQRRCRFGQIRHGKGQAKQTPGRIGNVHHASQAVHRRRVLQGGQRAHTTHRSGRWKGLPGGEEARRQCGPVHRLRDDHQDCVPRLE
ncbi:uncharacterized protein LOC119179496 isoform X2 [Rhipicephalus microplus]|uniref:uncharacterized protein LOC119179496 isoform X2 n=1 Tax=Rhipicephalus microplus TaxID=6941 RepID=UPI003F6B48F7